MISHYQRTWLFLSIVLFALLFVQGVLPKIVGVGNAELATSVASSCVYTVVFWYVVGSLLCSRRRRSRSSDQEERRRIVESPHSNDVVDHSSRLIPRETSASFLEVDSDSPPSSSLSSSPQQNDEEGVVARNNDNNNINNNNNNINNNNRLHYLDDVKIFLTVVVVAHHAACAFGAGGADSWYLIVGLPTYKDGDYGGVVHGLLGCFTLWNQGYFMTLFFFVSSYFTPGSYERKGKERFRFDRAKRYGIPLLFLTYVSNPLVAFVANKYSGNEKWSYGPDPGVAWFLMWLILLNGAYGLLAEAREKDDESRVSVDVDPMSLPPPPRREGNRAVPGLVARWSVGGLLVCGSLTYVAFNLVPGRFLSMPVSIGSLPCDLLFFALGTVAYRNGWLSNKKSDNNNDNEYDGGSSIRERVRTNIWCLRTAFVVEALLMAGLAGAAVSGDRLFALLFALVSGLYCVDAIVVVLDFFQVRESSVRGPWRRAASEAAYAVYLVHPVVVTTTTMAFVSVYNRWFVATDGESEPIAFAKNTSRSYSRLAGPDDGGLVLLSGWAFVTVFSNLVLWPLGWCLKRLPGLREVI